jgi:CRISPR/Cas system CSM-associated protein Csm3 (group 7 of RAMP superfamily)
VGGEQSDRNNPNKLWANNPITDDYDYLPKNKSGKDGAEIHKLSSFTDRLFGNTSLASRLRIEDAYPDPAKPVKTEERNGVAIDRVFGSVAEGPFNYQVCTAGEFQTKIHLKNFTLSQLGLIGLVLRDLNDGWFGIGFAKSRGLGTVQVKLNSAVVQYPSCELRDGQIYSFGQQTTLGAHNTLLGTGEFLEADNPYGFVKPDRQTTPIAATPMDLGFGVQLSWQGNDETGVPNLFKCAVRSWSEVLRRTAA